MREKERTQVGTMRVRRRMPSAEAPETKQAEDAVQWKQPPERHPGERLLRNMAVAGALVLCAVALRSGALPELSAATDAVLTAATDDSLLDDQLGRLSFVSALFPEATLVFGRSGDALSMPVSGGLVVHAWSEREPYMTWRTGDTTVRAAADGEVTGVYHGNGDERLVQVLGDDGLSCCYGNLGEVSVRTGEAVRAGDVVGTLLPGEDFVLEVRRDGMSIDPALLLGGV